ncbi:hypothetical protein TSAR_005677 [Trichomalopsis sarcophagae]|uniref:Uncharacterized protein n=1 Tax=Trichomalopsis sarcophagae TaxID=543379 RepID=A0A232EKC0_9HYME|nr:hypothetical protein TSAR_005677 [Trichomalopsis sarcophagae]
MLTISLSETSEPNDKPSTSCLEELEEKKRQIEFDIGIRFAKSNRIWFGLRELLLNLKGTPCYDITEVQMDQLSKFHYTNIIVVAEVYPRTCSGLNSTICRLT